MLNAPPQFSPLDLVLVKSGRGNMSEVLTCQVEVLDGSTVSIDVNVSRNGHLVNKRVFAHRWSLHTIPDTTSD